MNLTDLISSIGVLLILLAFFLQTFRYLHSEQLAYLLMNIIGSALACYGSYLLHSVPFMTLEGVWCIVAVIGLIRKKNDISILNK